MLVPLLITLVLFRESPARYGFTFGDWKAGLTITLSAWLLLAPVLYCAGRSPAMRAYYAWQLDSALPLWLAIEMIAWEYIFRGWLIQGYGRQFGASALWLQAVPFALAHLGKPALETLSTIFGGFAFGWVAWRTRSFIYPFLIHYFVYIFTVLIASGVLG
ncbi:MAG: CPBP family intramembrane metalloprotease, partial [Anaerolineae bacterium]|nr:CPBP family intramembrane metalloprotease [Anaerolineae bacterium]